MAIAKELTGKDLVLAFLYSPGRKDVINEPIIGRTRLTKMMFLFEKELEDRFFSDTIDALPTFIAYNYGPFSKELFENLDFFLSIGFIIASQTDVPLSNAEKEENMAADYESLDDEWQTSDFDDNDAMEMQYRLSYKGTQYVKDKVWGIFTEKQKILLKQFKQQINTLSLDVLLGYVYSKYPEMTENSLIKTKYVKS